MGLRAIFGDFVHLLSIKIKPGQARVWAAVKL